MSGKMLPILPFYKWYMEEEKITIDTVLEGSYGNQME